MIRLQRSGVSRSTEGITKLERSTGIINWNKLFWNFGTCLDTYNKQGSTSWREKLLIFSKWGAGTNQLLFLIPQPHLGHGDRVWVLGVAGWCRVGRVTLFSRHLDLCIWSGTEELAQIPALVLALSSSGWPWGHWSKDLKRQEHFFPLVCDRQLKKLFSGHCLTAER